MSTRSKATEGSIRSAVFFAAGIAMALGLLAWGFQDLRLTDLVDIIGNIGPAVALILLPYSVALLVDTLGWRRILRDLGHELDVKTLYATRLSTEALLMSAPAGPVVADTAKPILLQRSRGLPVSRTLASIAARKAHIVTTHGLFILLGVLVGMSLYSLVSERLVGGPGLILVGVAVSVAMVVAGLIAPIFFSKGRIARRLHGLLTKLSPRLLRERVVETRDGFVRLDAELETVFQVRFRRGAVTALLFLLMWLVETGETWLIFTLLGVDLAFHEVLAIETACSFIRSAAFFAPAGLGFQDLGYAGFIIALGVPNALAIGGAFSLLKRGKEALWVILGYVALVFFRIITGEPRNSEIEPISQSSSLSPHEMSLCPPNG